MTKKEISELIETTLGFTNGWRIPEEDYRMHCDDIAEQIVKKCDLADVVVPKGTWNLSSVVINKKTNKMKETILDFTVSYLSCYYTGGITLLLMDVELWYVIPLIIALIPAAIMTKQKQIERTIDELTKNK